MAEFKMPKYVCKDKPISLDECYNQLADMSYKSPINIIYQGFQTKLEGDIYEAIHSYGIDVDKDELVKALKYDRDQYKKGFADGCNDRTGRIYAEVAREIFEEIENWAFGFGACFVEMTRTTFDEIKKKYTEGDT